MLKVHETLSKVTAYYQAAKPYVCDKKVATVAATALGYIASVFSFFVMPLPFCAALTCASVAGTYASYKLVDQSQKEAAAKAKAKAEAEAKAKEVESAAKTAPVNAVSQAGFLSRLFGSATREATAPAGAV